MSEDIVTRLRRHRCVTGVRTVIDDAADEIERLRAERDDARREICQVKGTVRWNHYFPHFDPYEYAKNRGWDCFKGRTE
jgi:hypothetical protein